MPEKIKAVIKAREDTTNTYSIFLVYEFHNSLLNIQLFHNLFALVEKIIPLI